MNAIFPSLKTLRLTLRPLQPADAVVLQRIYQSEGVLRYFPNQTPPPLASLERFVAGQQAHWQQYGYGNWGIVPHMQEDVIGWVGLQFLPELNETEVGFLLDRPFWGKGYASEAALASVYFGFEQRRLDHIIALVHAENHASRRVIAKCGMHYVDTLELWDMQLLRHRVDRDVQDGSVPGA
jgi:RimJ/RimL family protein N-acetyltransferase